MGVYARKDSTFYWFALERPGQKAVRESSGIPVDGGTPFQTKENKKLAEEAYAQRMADFARQRYKLPTERQTITFRAYRAWYLANISVHKRNYTREKSMLGQLGAYFDNLELHQIDRERLQEWLTARRKEVSASTVKRERETFSALMASAIPKYLETNPLTGFPGKGQLRVIEREPRILTRQEEARLLKVLTDPQDYALIVCAIDTLMRLSDVVNLERAADKGAYLLVVNPKTKPYKVPVSNRLRKALNKIKSDSRWAFPKFHTWTGYESARRTARGRRGDRAAQHAAVRMFAEACALAKIPHGRAKDGVTFHCLRHTGASRALEAGADVRTVQELGGWSNLRQLTRYTHPTDEAKRRAVNAIGVTSHSRRTKEKRFPE